MTPDPDNAPETGKETKRPVAPRSRTNGATMIVLLVLAIVVGMIYVLSPQRDQKEPTFDFFVHELGTNRANCNIAEVTFDGLQLSGKFKTQPLKPPTADEQKPKSETPAAGKQVPSAAAKSKPESGDRYPLDFSIYLPPTVGEQFGQLLIDRGVVIRSHRPTENTPLVLLFYLGLPLLMFGAIWYMLRRARDQFTGGGLLSGFIKSPAQRYEVDQQRVTFNDVAGLEEVKRDLQEIIEYLKNPRKFERLGGRVPKGVLLVGPPGTGKTLLARAVAGEAGVPFFSISGSEFIQMFVGVGAGRVRDLFKTAKEAAPAILFIDEIDAVGRHRGAGLGGGHDEREQTLNQILSEMDGFQRNESVIVLAATNRPDVLDPALLRPGRFDRHVIVDRPSQKGRAAIFRVHSRNVPLADNVDIDRLAAGAVGLTGADIRNLVNEAALWATRQGKDKVEMSDFEYARDKILMGAKREEVLSEKEKRITAFHEAGHALTAWLLPGADRVHKVTIIPRGRSLGVTQLLPEEDRMNINETDLGSRLVIMLAGRAAEKLVFDQYSVGAENDLSEATKLARRMVAHWGMSERLGPVAYHAGEEHPFLGREIYERREFSEHTAQLIDEEVARVLHAASDRARAMLEKNRDKLDRLATALVEREILNDYEITQLVGPSANPRIESNGAPPVADGKPKSPSGQPV